MFIFCLVCLAQVPRTSENYIHRSGRTARADKQGVSVLLVSPQEMGMYQRICHNLNKVSFASSFGRSIVSVVRNYMLPVIYTTHGRKIQGVEAS